MKIFLQMDPPERFNPEVDSTFALGLEAQARGHELYYYGPSELFYENGRVRTKARSIRFFDRKANFFERDAPALYDLEQADMVLIRQEPPYDLQYLTACWLLERLHKPLILNDPAALRRRPEKLFPLALPRYCPPTLIAYDAAQIEAFYRQHEDIVLKPLFAHGGHGVVRLQPNDPNLYSLLELLMQNQREPIIAQPFLPEVMNSELRVLLVDGDIATAYQRIPKEGDFRANGVRGAQVAKATLNALQEEICHAVGEICRHEGFFFVGLDLIGDTLIEVNTTCPTGIRRATQLYGTNPAVTFWDKAEAKLQE